MIPKISSPPRSSCPGVSRREFLGRAALSLGAGLCWPTITVPRSWAQARIPANERITLGFIGLGGQGRGLLQSFLQFEDAQVIGVCDPWKDRRESAANRVDQSYTGQNRKGSYRGCAGTADFRDLLARDDLDAVVIATPDHWHVPMALEAVRAGKDLYVEKPLGLSVEQDRALRQAVHSAGAVFQYGTQQRGFHTHCARGCELVRNGALGALTRIDVVAPDGSAGGDPRPQPAPEGLEYDLWLGPAPRTPYCPDRVLGLGRWFIYDYAIGFIAGWGAHPLDIAHWGYPHVPVEYEGQGLIPSEGLFDTVVHWDVRGRYASGVEFTLKVGSDRTCFVGAEGWVAVSRAGIEASPPSLLRVHEEPGAIRLLQDSNHHRNFLTCIRSRSTPASDIDSAVQSDIMSHLSEIAIRTGRRIRWDPDREEIVGDPSASRLLSRPMREPWRC